MTRTTALTAVALGTIASLVALIITGSGLAVLGGMLFVGFLFFVLIGASTV
jgi:hypothetical protein